MYQYRDCFSPIFSQIIRPDVLFYVFKGTCDFSETMFFSKMHFVILCHFTRNLYHEFRVLCERKMPSIHKIKPSHVGTGYYSRKENCLSSWDLFSAVKQEPCEILQRGGNLLNQSRKEGRMGGWAKVE